MENTDKIIAQFQIEFGTAAEHRYIALAMDGTKDTILYEAILLNHNKPEALEDKVNNILSQYSDVTYALYDGALCVFLRIVETFKNKQIPEEALKARGEKTFRSKS